MALAGSHTDTAHALLRANPEWVTKAEYDEDFFDIDSTPLHVAAAHAETDMIEQLLGANADVNAASDLHWTPLAVAARRQPPRPDIMQLLIDGGADHGTITFAMDVAIRHADFDCVTLLLEAKANITDSHIPDAVKGCRGDLRILQLLRDRGANFAAMSYDVVSAAAKYSPEALPFLLELKVDLNARSARGATAFFGACAAGVRALAQFGVDPNARDDQGASALHAAESSDQVRALLEVKADIHATDGEGRTALHCSRSATVLTTLVDHGAALEARDTKGNTPLIKTAQPATLLAQRANIEATNNKGLTALQTARQAGAFLIKQQLFLLQCGADPYHLPPPPVTPDAAVPNLPLDLQQYWRGAVTAAKLAVVMGLHPRVGRSSSVQVVAPGCTPLSEPKMLQLVFAFAYSRDPTAAGGESRRRVRAVNSDDRE